MDPQDVLLATALGQLSYNQVMNELVITQPDDISSAPSAPPPEAFEHDISAAEHVESPTTAHIRETRPLVLQFLETSAAMLTIYGLAELHACVEEGDIVVLFRNSHFYVMKKYERELYVLVTDVGFKDDIRTWEKMCDVQGDSEFYNANFCRVGADGIAVGEKEGSKNGAQSGGSGVGRGSGSVRGRGRGRGAASAGGRASGTGSRRAAPVASKPSKSDKCVIQ